LSARDDASAPTSAGGLRLIGFRSQTEPAIEPDDDVALVGMLAYRILTGEPLKSDAPEEPVRSALPGMHAAVARVFDRALDLGRSNRWPNARAMKDALADAREQALRVKTGPGIAAAMSAEAPSSMPRSRANSLSSTGSSDMFTSVDVRRMMP